MALRKWIFIKPWMIHWLHVFDLRAWRWTPFSLRSRQSDRHGLWHFFSSLFFAWKSEMIISELQIRVLSFQNAKISKLEYQTLCCGCSLESSQWDWANEYPQHRVWMRACRFRMPSLLFIWSSAYLDNEFWRAGL